VINEEATDWSNKINKQNKKKQDKRSLAKKSKKLSSGFIFIVGYNRAK
jgi:hypothetical protein